MATDENDEEREGAAPDEQEARAPDLDPETQEQLSRWFGLPSFEELEERGEAPPMEPDFAAERRKIQAAASAAVDPALLEALYARADARASVARLEILELGRLDPSISALDPMLLGRVDAAAEPRTIELPMGIQDALAECTPQAVLRDLHRPEIYFDRRYEVDEQLAALMMVDPLNEVRQLLATRIELQLPEPPLAEARASIAEMTRAKRAPWSQIRTPTRRVGDE